MELDVSLSSADTALSCGNISLGYTAQLLSSFKHFWQGGVIRRCFTEERLTNHASIYLCLFKTNVNKLLWHKKGQTCKEHTTILDYSFETGYVLVIYITLLPIFAQCLGEIFHN